MQNGIYWVDFQSRGASGAGLIVLKDGSLNGGDQGYIYSGTYSVNGNNVTARARIIQHNSSWQSIFGNIPQFDLQLSGISGQGQFSLNGSIPNVAGASIGILGRRLGDVS
jgi:hypothetical protein